MERTDKIVTQEDSEKIRAEIMRLEMEQHLQGVDNSARIQELKERLS